ncbi:MAG: hypothetical protein CBCREVIR_3306 [Candidatus Burkholderia crenata]|nr:MAG: hypothetical protein CBCREVIR_3306 [Candidatus Burkholderia crenata]
MILTGPEIAYALELAEAGYLRRQVETYRELTCQLPHRESARAIAVSGGIAAVTETVFGRKLNHVTGLGMEEEPVREKAVEELERAYAKLDLDVEIDLCPYAIAPRSPYWQSVIMGCAHSTILMFDGSLTSMHTRRTLSPFKLLKREERAD